MYSTVYYERMFETFHIWPWLILILAISTVRCAGFRAANRCRCNSRVRTSVTFRAKRSLVARGEREREVIKPPLGRFHTWLFTREHVVIITLLLETMLGER